MGWGCVVSDSKERVFAYASACFMRDVEALLDDPYGVLAADDQKVFFTALRERAVDLQMNLDLLIDQLGTKFEATRLRELMHRN